MLNRLAHFCNSEGHKGLFLVLFSADGRTNLLYYQFLHALTRFHLHYRSVRYP